MNDTHSRFAIEAVQPHEIDDLLRLYVDLFHGREPLTACLGFGRERMAAIARAMHHDDAWTYDGAKPFAGHKLDCHLMWRDLS